MDILQTGFEADVRSRLGVDDTDLPDTEINKPMVAGLAEAVLKKRVPAYVSITDPVETLFLQSAVINYTCHLLAPTMANRINVEVATLDVKWKKDKVNWKDRAMQFLADCEDDLSRITSVEVTFTDVPLMGIGSTTRTPLGSVQV